MSKKQQQEFFSPQDMSMLPHNYFQAQTPFMPHRLPNIRDKIVPLPPQIQGQRPPKQKTPIQESTPTPNMARLTRAEKHLSPQQNPLLQVESAPKIPQQNQIPLQPFTAKDKHLPPKQRQNLPPLQSPNHNPFGQPAFMPPNQAPFIQPAPFAPPFSPPPPPLPDFLSQKVEQEPILDLSSLDNEYSPPPLNEEIPTINVVRPQNKIHKVFLYFAGILLLAFVGLSAFLMLLNTLPNDIVGGLTDKDFSMIKSYKQASYIFVENVDGMELYTTIVPFDDSNGDRVEELKIKGDTTYLDITYRQQEIWYTRTIKFNRLEYLIIKRNDSTNKISSIKTDKYRISFDGLLQW